MTIRGGILDNAKAATCGDRNHSYGAPYHQLGLAGDLKDNLRAAHEAFGLRKISSSEWEAVDMVCTKLSRIVLGRFTPDNYVDAAAYAAIAGEAAAIYNKLLEDVDTDD